MQAGSALDVSDGSVAAVPAATPRVALVHDWLTGMRGGERCLEVFCELFPDAPLYTLLHVPGSVSPIIERRRIVTSFVQRLPAAATGYRRYLPLFPAAMRSFDLRDYDLVLSLQPLRGQGRARPARRAARLLLLHADALRVGSGRRLRGGRGPVHATAVAADGRGPAPLGSADRRRRATFVAISSHIADRIRRGLRPRRRGDPSARGRARASGSPTGVDDYYLVVSALVPYKRVDLAIRRGRPSGAPARGGRAGARVATAPRAGRPQRHVSRLAERRGGGRALRAVPGGALPGRRGLRHRAARGHGRRPSDDRAGPRWRAGDDDRARRWRRAARPRSSSASRRWTRWRRPSPRSRTTRRASIPRRCGRGPSRFDRPIFARRVQAVPRAPLARVPGGRGVLKAHSRLFEHLTLATDLGAHRRLLARQPTRCASTSSARWRRHSAVP